MRTLSRPMFNMGGPIKEGVMHGIREPYKGGGKAALVGNPLYPRTAGREHHQLSIGAGMMEELTGGAQGYNKQKIAQKVAQETAKKAKMFQKAGNIISKGIPIGSRFSEQGIMKAIGSMFKKRAPQVFPRLAGLGTTLTAAPLYGYKKIADALQKNLEKQGLTGEGGIYDTSGGWGAMAAGADVPPEVDAIMRGEQIDITGKPLKTLDENLAIKDYGPYTKGPPTETESMRSDKAKADKDARVNKLLEMMGHKQSKKDAVYNALIDASQIIGAAPGGKGLDISKDIIQPVIGATSKRFDKPKEISEAVRLMMVKGEIEKDIFKSKGTSSEQAIDALATASGKSRKYIANAKLGIANTPSEAKAMLAKLKNTRINSDDLTAVIQAYADDKNIPFKKQITTDQKNEVVGKGKKYASIVDMVTDMNLDVDGADDGLYVVGTSIIQVEGGIPKLRG